MNWGAIGAIVSIIGLTFGVGTWVKSLDEEVNNLKTKTETLERETKIPKDAVVAFYRNEKCPVGWTIFSELSGRTIIGVGRGTELTNRRLGDKDGQEEVPLKNNEMPAHSHSIEGIAVYAAPSTPETLRVFSPHQKSQFKERSIKEGDGQPHNNMPPYYALLYCRKD